MKLKLSEKIILRQLVASAVANRQVHTVGDFDVVECSAKFVIWSNDLDSLFSLCEKLENALS